MTEVAAATVGPSFGEAGARRGPRLPGQSALRPGSTWRPRAYRQRRRRDPGGAAGVVGRAESPGAQQAARGRVWSGSPSPSGERLRAAGYLIERGLFPALSLLGYETPGKVDGCHG